MYVDLWTKIALTVIAFSLAVIAWETATSHAQFDCGNHRSPCYIAMPTSEVLKVEIVNR